MQKFISDEGYQMFIISNYAIVWVGQFFVLNNFIVYPIVNKR